MKIFKFILLCLVGFNFLFSIGCSDSSGGSSKRKPDLEDPDFRVNPPSPGPSRGPGFIIRGLPDYDVTVSIFRGPRSTSQCTDADLIPLGDPVRVSASENEITVNLGNVLENASDGIYRFFARIEGGPRVHCFELTYVLDTTVPRIIANTLEQNPLENDDTMRMSKTWNWSCVDRDGVNCTYRHKIDETALTGSSCPSYTFASNESYSSVSTATKPGGSGKYCIHIQAMDDANNESEVVSVYATLDNTAPTISSVSVPSKTYAGGDRMDFTVTFSEDVEVTGTPRISLILDGGGQPKMEYAEYASGSGSTSLIFRYEVGQTDLDTDGIGMGASPSIDLNSGNLKDSSGNAVSSLTFTAPGNLSSVVVAGGNPNVVLSLTELSVEENAGTGTYQIRLNSQPTSAVTVALGSADSSVATVSPGTLSFSTDNWSSPQTVTVTGVNDSIDNDAGGGSLRTVNITHTVTSSDADYNNFSVSPVEITSNDNDDIGSIRLTVNPSSVDEHDSGSSRSIANNTETIVVIASFHGSTSGGQANANIRLPGPLTISASLEAGTAQIGDFNPVSDFDLNIPAGSNQVIGAFSLTVVDDGEDEGNEILLLRGVNPLGLTVSPATITIVDNDEKGVIVSRFTLSVGENGGEGTYTVKLDSQPAGPVTVHIVSNDPDVVTVSDDTLTFEPDDTNNKIWSAPQTVTVTGVNDDIDNDVGGGVSRKTNVTHSVTSTDPHYNGLSVDSTEVTASDDDHIGFIQLTVSPASVDEHDDNSPNAIANNTETVAVTAEFQGGTSGGQANANIRLPGPLTISASVGAGTAQAADFTTVNNFDITIPSGGSRGTGTFSLTLVDDELDDNDETLSVSGSTPLGLTINPATITIVDNDDRGLIISHSTLSLVEDGTRTYTVQLSQEPTGSVYVTLISGDTNVATISHTLLTFEPDNTNNNIWSAPHTVTVTGINDNMDNDFGGNPHRTTDITYDVSSTDTDYNGLVVSPMKVTSVDDDNVGSVQLTISPTSMNEHDGALPNQQANNTKNIMVTAKFQGSTSGGSPSSSVVLSDPLAISTFVSRRTAQIEDFIPASNFDINIPAGSNQAEVTFPLTLVDDFIDEDDETLIVGGHTLFSSIVVNPATLTILDNDEKGVTISETSLIVYEDGGTGTYEVSLKSEPTGPVTVHIVSNDPDVVTVSDDTLTFEPDDTNDRIWTTPLEVTVTGVNDTSSTNDRQTTITHTVTGGDYGGFAAAGVSITSRDSSRKVTIDNAVDILSDNYESYSVGGFCSGTESVSVQVGSTMTAEDTDCTNGEWLEEIDTSSDVTANGPVTITATQDITVSGTTTSFSDTVDVTRCVSQGTGTSSTDPHWICNYSDLKSMFTVSTRKYFVLGMDIDASPSWSEGDDGCVAFDGTNIYEPTDDETVPCAGWIPLSIASTTGELDGQGHIIENLYVNSGLEYVGLFGSMGIKVKNLHLRKVFVNSTLITTKVASGVGGIAGNMRLKDIENCSVTGKIFSKAVYSAGGLAGVITGDIINSYADVEVLNSSGANAGGLVGFTISNANFISSFTRGSVTNNSIGADDNKRGYAGGLVGNDLGSDFYACYSHASVSGGEKSGGLIGNTLNPNILRIHYSYSLGSGSPDDPLFDFGEETLDGSSNLFWDTSVGGNSSEAPTSTGLSTANMQVACSSSSTTGICALGAGFSFSAGSYPKVRKCTDCRISNLVFGDVLEGQ